MRVHLRALNLCAVMSLTMCAGVAAADEDGDGGLRVEGKLTQPSRGGGLELQGQLKRNDGKRMFGGSFQLEGRLVASQSFESDSAESEKMRRARELERISAITRLRATRRTNAHITTSDGAQQPYFEQPLDLRFEDLPRMFAGDINGDGLTDVVVSHLDGTSLTSLIGIDERTFEVTVDELLDSDSPDAAQAKEVRPTEATFDAQRPIGPDASNSNLTDRSLLADVSAIVETMHRIVTEADRSAGQTFIATFDDSDHDGMLDAELIVDSGERVKISLAIE